MNAKRSRYSRALTVLLVAGLCASLTLRVSGETTTTQQGPNTVTVETKSSSYNGGEQASVETTVKNTKTGQLVSAKLISTNKVGGKLEGAYSDNKIYNELGGYTYTYSDEKYDKSGQLVNRIEGTTTYDAGRNVQSGESTHTWYDEDRTKHVTKQTWDPRTKKWGPEVTIGAALPAPKLEPIQPTENVSATADETAYLPDVASPSSQIVGTYVVPGNTGASDVVVLMTALGGTSKYYKVRTDGNHHVFLPIPDEITEVWLFKEFDHGKPDARAVKCQVARNGTVPQTDVVANVPANGLAITRGSSAYERGGSSNGVINLQTRGNDPVQSHVLLDNSTAHVVTLAASDQSVKARLADDAPLGRHMITLASGERRSNTFPTDIASLRVDPLQPADVGTVQPVTVHVDGLPPGDSATMSFAVGGAATLADGSLTATVPVTDNLARVQVRGTRAGAALLRYRLRANIAGFWQT